MASTQDYPSDFGTPLLFTLPSEQPAEYRTPLARSPLRDSGTISSARRSVTPPGSVHTDTTPPRPPPIARLHDTLMTDAEPSASPPAPAAAAAATPLQFGGGSLAAAAAAQQGAADGSGNLMRVEAHSAPEDSCWVTVFGFVPDDLPLVLREFQRCGDILQWGTFGASPQSNFMHLQFQTKYGGQRALLRNGEQLSGSLIIGVKPLEPRHRALVDAWASGGGGAGGAGAGAAGAAGAMTSPGPRIKPASAPLRPYMLVDGAAAAAQALPMRSRTWAQKVGEFVFGV